MDIEFLKKKKKTKPKRGYYSEVIGTSDHPVELQEEFGAPKRRNLTSELETERYAPLLPYWIGPPDRKTFLAPAQRWITFDESEIAFPIDAFKPKVQREVVTQPRTLPRNVLIERRRREYCTADIGAMLEAAGVDKKDLVPTVLMDRVLKRQEKFQLNQNIPFLPLELFDNDDYEIRSPFEWTMMGVVDGVRHPLPADAFLPIFPEVVIAVLSGSATRPLHEVYGWLNVAVIDYYSYSNRYKVRTLNETDAEYEIPRIYFKFKAEDPKNYVARVKDALERRKEVEQSIRYQTFLDCMMFPGLQELDEAAINKILELATRKGKLNLSERMRAKLEKELRLHHERTSCDITFRGTLSQSTELQEFVTVPPTREEKYGAREAIKTGMVDFNGVKNYIHWDHLFVIPESYLAVLYVVGECMAVGNMNFYNLNYGKYVPLDEFESIQANFTQNVIKYLKTKWLDDIVLHVRIVMRDVGKGWFNLEENSHEIYDMSKLMRLMELFKFHMQDAIRKLVENSVTTYLTLLETPCVCTLDVPEDFEWGDDFLRSSFVPVEQPIFFLQLMMNENIAYYSTDTSRFKEVVMRLYDSAIRASHFVPQVHPFLLKNLKFAHDLNLSSMGLMNPRILNVRKRLEIAYTQAHIPLVAYAKEFNRFIPLWKTDVSQYVSEFASREPPSEEVRTEIADQLRLRKNLEGTIPQKSIIGPFFINVDPLRSFLIQKRKDLMQKLLDYFAGRQRQLVDQRIQDYKNIQKQLLEEPTSIEHLLEIKDNIEAIPYNVDQTEDAVKDIMMDYDICEEFLYPLSNEDFDAKWEVLGWPYKILSQIDNVNQFLEGETDKFLKIQLDDEANIVSKIEQMTSQVQALTGVSDMAKVHETAQDIRRLWKAMKETQEFGQLLNQRQKLFGLKVKPFDSLNKLIEEFEPYRNLWVSASDWLRNHEIWTGNPLELVDPEGVENTVNEFYKIFQKSMKLFSEIPAVFEIAKNMKEEIEDFMDYVPVLVNLRNPAMKERHWDKFRDETGIEIEWGPKLAFQDVLELNVMEHKDVIAKIAETAEKEYAIEKGLKDMQTEWEGVKMEVTQYKDTDTFKMKVDDETLQLIDDHIQMTQQISFSPFRGAFEEDIAEWEEKLKLTSEVLEEWMELQKSWLYLEPIFTSGDINRQLPSEGKKYAGMERIWKKNMKMAHDNPRIMDICPSAPLLQSLKEARNMLDQVEKGLSDYLETKRSNFPRLYFLSDDELLEILAQSKDPRAVQPHLRKCFENIAKLKFESDLKITAMMSAEGESVNLTPSLYPEGNVEDWLRRVEESMCNTVRLLLGNALKDLDKCKTRGQWVVRWPGQVVIAGSQTSWTAEVEHGIRSKTLSTYYQVMLDNLDELRNLVKGQLKPVEREVICALIVIEVHARDVTQTLVNINVQNVNEFDWISQLRYYWDGEGQVVRVVNAEFPYGYEYLGNSGRLVITPLTDRCYLTLTGALHLKFGGAPAGPAGTGKTETTKDLAKAMAIQCVVFNCSDQLDVIYMGKFFKGLASSGAWACFDEFNRIDIEVLSVVAQQITAIQQAQAAHAERFTFEGDDIVLKQSCAVFITMNPGYAGRTELPDNLKALFRPVAMMVPNYALIAEISLFSFGFSDARDLAGKITTTFKLSSEQLSTQDHYDFGMRAVKTVIAVAGNLKRERPTMDEKQIILRAIRDVNVPKFLKDDLKLFQGIVSDLFPRMKEEVIDYGSLEEAIRKDIAKKNLEDVPLFVGKVIQLYETTVVRHGLMLVGPTGSGKTKCYDVLADAITSLKGEMSPGGSPFVPIHTYVVNPKSITMGQLYGQFDLLTHEWTDGILASLVRVGTMAEDTDKRWYIFDGPVDAVWIENMNSVLDDNKKLCLSSGEIISLTRYQSMIFEVADLAVASPATVSRCGMVYLEPAVLGLTPFVNCWMKRQPKQMDKHLATLNSLIDHYLWGSLDFMRANTKELVASMDSALVFSFLQLLDVRIVPLTQPGGKPLPPEQFIQTIPALLEPWVIFAVIWSVGATCDNRSRDRFSDWMRQLAAKSKGKAPPLPPKETVYDYNLDDGGFATATKDATPTDVGWIHWMKNIDTYNIKEDTRFADIEVPTVDNVRNAFVLGMLAFNEHQVLCIGPTGTGKTLTISSKLGRDMPKKFVSDFITFSARTSANQTQDLLDSKLEKRRKGVFGPPMMKKAVFFIDDLNMPALEVYGAQPPIELIRQWMDFGGWYDRKIIGEFREIVDVTFVGAMCPPGGGRNPITPRLLRHFHYLAFIELEDNSKSQIFGTILQSWLRRAEESVQALNAPLVKASMSVYSTIVTELLPTPAKTHYTFNLRDLSKVFQGMLMCKPNNIKVKEDVLRLWYHECCRVFQDRLVNDEDREWFKNLLKSKLTDPFKVNPEEILGEGDVLFCDFLGSQDQPNYALVEDVDEATIKIETFLDDYNHDTTAPMPLVLFQDAIRHLCRISRIIRQPMGNALLLGMSGSGRASLSRLASYIADFTTFQIELTKNYGVSDWRDNIKVLMMKAGVSGQGTVFIFLDTQVKDECFLEDLNNILNSGDVPNIYQIDELETIYASMKGTVQQMGLDTTRANLFSAYQKSVRSNLHVCLTMSPIGETFRARLRQFPALVNCCTIDWFSAWPEAALRSVAMRFLDEVPDLGDAETIEGIVVTVQNMHQSVVDASVRYQEELNRTNYVTPTSYLELLRSYCDLVTKKRDDLTNYMKRLKTGLETLLDTVQTVKELQVELSVMKPKLAKASEESSAMLEKISADRAVAEETKVVVQKEEQAATEKAQATQAIADDAQRDLDEALPMLQAAENSLKALNKGDIAEVRAFKRPPPAVQLVLEAICIVKDIKPVKIAGPMPGEKVLDYWEPSRGMLSNADAFMQSLLNFDKESVTDQKQKQLQPYIDDPNFQPAKILAVSKACTSLCMWVHAIYKYYFVNKAVAPKKAALAQAKSDLEKTLAMLKAAKDNMQKVLDGLALLEQELKATEARKAQLEETMQQCQDRMDRAVRLVGGLADERERWVVNVENIGVSIVNIIGDIIISAGAIAYLTPFTDQYRRRLLREWLDLMVKVGVPHSLAASPVDIMGDPVAIRNWQLCGLPRDNLSTENAVLVFGSQRWPLFVDPQGQANRWIRNMGKESGMIIAKLTDKDLQRSLEGAVRFGKMCLIENVGKELDPLLDPILLRQIYRQGGTDMIKIGDNTVPYSHQFRLFMTTKLPNPSYPPEIGIKVLLVNFALIPSGLEDQLLALVVMSERPDLEEARGALIVQNAEMKNDLKEIEDKILVLLAASAAKGNPVDDIELITTLETSKVKSEEIKEKVAAAEETQIEIDDTRALYIPVAKRAQIIFFCLVDLATVDPMYQYSLEWFTGIFTASMQNTEKSNNIAVRVNTINDHFTFSLFCNVCRSLFEKNKLHFAFLLCTRIQMADDLIDMDEWRHFLAGASPAEMLKNPASEWLSEKAWLEIQSLELLPSFKNFITDFTTYKNDFKRLFDSQAPHEERLIPQWENKLNHFQRLLVLKSLRPDKVMNALQNYIAHFMGQRFIEPQTSDVSEIFGDSSNTIPLIFILSPGTDPASELYKFATKMNFTTKLFVISLGQGQGPRAEAMMDESMDHGYWVFFQNCHLAPSWMPRLEYLIENIDVSKTHKDFRVWLTSSPSPDFPVPVLQNSSKMTIEPPRGIKANMIRSYTTEVTDMKEFFESEDIKLPAFKSLLFALCLFHGACIERRKFGPLGFNIAYEFTSGDLRICISQLKMFILEYDDVPFKVLSYTAGQINYGGRVTDDWDRRCIMNILSDYYDSKVMQPEYKFDKAGAYCQQPSDITLEGCLNYLKTLPLNDDPDIFGLHANADISCAQQETIKCLTTLLALQPRTVGGQSTSQEEITAERANDILNTTPKPLNVAEISEKYPVQYEESLNTVLVQEIIRYNPLLKLIHNSLTDLLKALKGLVVMSEALENLNASLFTNVVPQMWNNKAYPSLKPLGAWVLDLKERIDFINKWVDHGIPITFWISGFFFPQAFLTGNLQNYARKYVISIDTLAFGFRVHDGTPYKKPEDGCYVYGLFLEGARWDPVIKGLGESRPKELFTQFPIIWMVPEKNHVTPSSVYESPVYKTLTRAGTLSTTGHSTNYVVTMELPSREPQKHWIKRGVALICALDY